LQEDVKALSETATAAAKKADVVLIVVDSARCTNVKYHDAFCELVRVGLDNAKKEIILVLNKVDLIKPKSKLLEITRMLVSLVNGVKWGPGNENRAKLDTTTFMVSAMQNDGLVDIKNYLIGVSDIKPWVLSAKAGVTGVKMEKRVEEMVLEKMLEYTHEEIPYICDIECTSIENITRSGNRVEVNVDIWVDTPGQQRIIVGQQGRTLVKIRQETVADLELIMGVQVILKLWVKLRSSKEGLKRGADDEEEEE
jgi:GTP-binding protein Era